MKYFLKNSNMKKLTQDEARFCEQPITENEILNSLKNLHNQKTPGTDGLPADFYKFFWIDIKNLLMNSILYAIDSGELSVEQKRGIITLLPPKNKDRLHWRPISLLNTDYKLKAKLIPNILKEILPSIIDNDKSGYLSGRNIGQYVHLFQDITFFTEANKIPGILLAIEFENSFD